MIDDKLCKNLEKITVSSTAIGLTAGFLTPDVKDVLITCEDQDVRFRCDGTDPTAAVGHPLATGDSIQLSKKETLAKLRFIRKGGTDGTIMVSYWATV